MTNKFKLLSVRKASYYDSDFPRIVAVFENQDKILSCIEISLKWKSLGLYSSTELVDIKDGGKVYLNKITASKLEKLTIPLGKELIASEDGVFPVLAKYKEAQWEDICGDFQELKKIDAQYVCERLQRKLESVRYNNDIAQAITK
jgi:hypothetical protein